VVKVPRVELVVGIPPARVNAFYSLAFSSTKREATRGNSKSRASDSCR
jgi:hypothetical protein